MFLFTPFWLCAWHSKVIFSCWKNLFSNFPIMCLYLVVVWCNIRTRKPRITLRVFVDNNRTSENGIQTVQGNIGVHSCVIERILAVKTSVTATEVTDFVFVERFVCVGLGTGGDVNIPCVHMTSHRTLQIEMCVRFCKSTKMVRIFTQDLYPAFKYTVISSHFKYFHKLQKVSHFFVQEGNRWMETWGILDSLTLEQGLLGSEIGNWCIW